jgi:carbon monoxide dehydrogenase subunit G
MPDVSSEIELGAPPEEVWEVLMDPQRLGDWVTTHVALGDGTPNELSEGSSFEQTLKVGGPKFDVTWKVIEADRPRKVEWAGDGPAGSSASVVYELEPHGAGATKFTYVNDFKLPGGPLGRLAGRTVGAATARREAERSLANLKQLVEG